MAAPEDAATVADLEWWLFEQYFKPHGLSFDGKTVPPVEKIAAAPDLEDMSAAPTTTFEAIFKVAFKPLMKYLDFPGPLFAYSRFLKAIGSLDAKAAWMFHRNEEAVACKNFRWKDWKNLAVQAARMQSFSESSEGWKVRSYLWSEGTSSRYLWEIISLGKLDLPTCRAEVLAEVVIAARVDIFYELVKRGCAYAPVSNRDCGGGHGEISILHYAIGNPQFLEPLLDVPEVRRSGWGTAIDALLPGRRSAISANHPPSEVLRIFEVLMSRVEPDIIESHTLKKIAKWLGAERVIPRRSARDFARPRRDG
ncbi:hypothetical protein HDU90_004270 [Geranomyces variabilis]|nr:hypothetical protein HDU90_004270 [Geranomyces variabilis]